MHSIPDANSSNEKKVEAWARDVVKTLVRNRNLLADKKVFPERITQKALRYPDQPLQEPFHPLLGPTLRRMVEFASSEWSEWMPSQILPNIDQSDHYNKLISDVYSGNVTARTASLQIGRDTRLAQWAELYVDLCGPPIDDPEWSGKAVDPDVRMSDATEVKKSSGVGAVDQSSSRVKPQAPHNGLFVSIILLSLRIKRI